jgi:hypothetical protein
MRSCAWPEGMAREGSGEYRIVDKPDIAYKAAPIENPRFNELFQARGETSKGAPGAGDGPH